MINVKLKHNCYGFTDTIIRLDDKFLKEHENREGTSKKGVGSIAPKFLEIFLPPENMWLTHQSPILLIKRELINKTRNKDNYRSCWFWNDKWKIYSLFAVCWLLYIRLMILLSFFQYIRLCHPCTAHPYFDSTLHWDKLQCTALQCIELIYTSLHCSKVKYSTMQCSAVQFNIAV